MPKYSIDEIIELTLEKEIMRRDFYAESAERFKNPAAKKLFADLKDWEEIHVVKVRELKDKLKVQPYVDSSLGEVRAYLRSVVDSKLYNSSSIKDFVEKIKNLQETIDCAIGFEKDAILFFAEVLSFLSDKDRKVVKKLIEEEKKHIQYLLNLRDKV